MGRGFINQAIGFFEGGGALFTNEAWLNDNGSVVYPLLSVVVVEVLA